MNDLKQRQLALEQRVQSNISDTDLPSLIEEGVRNMLDQDEADGTSVGSQKIDSKISNQRKLHLELLQKAVDRLRNLRYVWLRGEVRNQKSKSWVYCPKHNAIHEIQLCGLSGGSEQRPRNPHGLLCCANEAHLQITREFAAGRKKTPEQRAIEKKAKQGVTTKRKQILSNAQKKEILNLWNNTCPLTGLTTNLEVHHLYSEAHYPELAQVFDNCIVLHTSMHNFYHQTLYMPTSRSYSEATPGHFLNFLDWLVISNQGALEEVHQAKRDNQNSPWYLLVTENAQQLIPRIRQQMQNLENNVDN